MLDGGRFGHCWLGFHLLQRHTLDSACQSGGVHNGASIVDTSGRRISRDGDGVFDFPKVEAIIVFGGSSTKVTFLFVPVEVVVFTMVHLFLISAVAKSAVEILEFLKVEAVYVVFGFRGRRREAGKLWRS